MASNEKPQPEEKQDEKKTPAPIEPSKRNPGMDPGRRDEKIAGNAGMEDEEDMGDGKSREVDERRQAQSGPGATGERSMPKQGSGPSADAEDEDAEQDRDDSRRDNDIHTEPRINR